MTGTWRDTELSGACRYRLVRRLGAGGMGEVYLATQEGPGGFSREVVLKRMLPHLADDPAGREMFLDEARLTARLDHPSIVKIIELGVHDGVAFFAMEYVPGPTLSEVVRAGPPPVLAAFVVREVCRALGYAHALCDRDGAPLGMVHRDVSPSNIMITPNGGVKLLDFGIAKALISLATTKAGTVKGKLAYMAPERLRGLPADHRADLFSVGIVLHEALTGYRLFDAATPEAVLELIRAPLPLPSETAPDVPPALDVICLRALAERPEDRYPTADAMADALDAVLFEARFGGAQAGAFVQRVWRPPEPGAPPPLPASSEEASTWDAGMVLPSLDPDLDPVRPRRSDPDLVQLGLAATAAAEVEHAAPARRPPRARRWRWLAAGAAAAAIAAATGTWSMRGADRGERAPVVAVASGAAPAWLSAGLTRMPAGADAARWYRAGIAELRLGNSLAARIALEKSVGAEPSHAPSHLALAKAWAAQGYRHRAEEEAASASALAHELDDGERLPIEAYLHELRGDRSRALAAYRQLLARDPGDLEIRLSLATAQLKAGHIADALATLSAPSGAGTSRATRTTFSAIRSW